MVFTGEGHECMFVDDDNNNKEKRGGWGGGELTMAKAPHVVPTYRTNPGTKAEPQQIVAQRLLSCLQYLVP